jgi:hypothetical protein
MPRELPIPPPPIQHNTSHPFCHYYCHNPHITAEFTLPCSQLGFWLPHGLSTKGIKRRWGKGTIKRLEGFREGFKVMFGVGSCENVAEVLECVRLFAEIKSDDGGGKGREVTRQMRASSG